MILSSTAKEPRASTCHDTKILTWAEISMRTMKGKGPILTIPLYDNEVICVGAVRLFTSVPGQPQERSVDVGFHKSPHFFTRPLARLVSRGAHHHCAAALCWLPFTATSYCHNNSERMKGPRDLYTITHTLPLPTPPLQLEKLLHSPLCEEGTQAVSRQAKLLADLIKSVSSACFRNHNPPFWITASTKQH